MADINEQLQRQLNLSATNYSSGYFDLVKQFDNSPELVNNSPELQAINWQQQLDAPFLSNYKYPVSRCPIVIDNHLVAQFEQFCQQFAPMLYDAIACYFGKDAQAFERYCQVPAMVFELFCEHSNHPAKQNSNIAQLLLRYDLVFSQGDFKLLEVNSGCTLGGWEFDWISKPFVAPIAQQLAIAPQAIESQRMVTSMFTAVIKAIASNFDGIDGRRDASGNLIISRSFLSMLEGRFLHVDEVFAKLYQQIASKYLGTGELIFFDDFNQLSFDAQGQVSYQGQLVDACFMPIEDETCQQLLLNLVSSTIKGQLIFPDSPIHQLVGNKLLLSLFFEDKVQDIFTPQQKAWIERYIPWAVKLEDKQVVYGANQYRLYQLLLEQKDQFVLKKARSSQGADVYIGKHLDAGTWHSLLERLLANSNENSASGSDGNDWLVQQYCPSDAVWALDNQKGVIPHHMVWGIYQFAHAYAGAYVRGVAVDDCIGAINSATGATGFVVLELSELPRASEPKQSANNDNAQSQSIAQILSLCQQHQVTLDVVDGSLDIGFDDELPDELLILLKANKAALIEFLATVAQEQDLSTQPSSINKAKPVQFGAQNQPQFPLSAAQQRLWFVDRLENGSAHFNMSYVIDIKGKFDIDKANYALLQIIRRHHVLRSTYVEQSGVALAQVNSIDSFTIEVINLANAAANATVQQLLDEQINSESNTAFDLASELPVRAKFYQLDENNGALQLVVHHIACDGWSLAILVNEFCHFYVNSHDSHSLSDDLIQYADYAVWHQQQVSEQSQSLLYWREHLASAPAMHSLILERPRAQVTNNIAKVITHQLGQRLSNQLTHVSQRVQLTPFMLLHAVLALVLARYSNNSDIVIGTPTANRNHLAVEPLIGFFVNTMVLRAQTDFADVHSYFEQIKQVNLDAQANQQVLLEQIADALDIAGTSDYVRLTQIILTLNNNQVGELDIPGLTLTPRARGQEAGAKFDIEISVSQHQQLEISWIYHGQLFSCSQIEQMSGDFNRLLTDLLAKLLLMPSTEIALNSLQMATNKELALWQTGRIGLLETQIETRYSGQSEFCKDNTTTRIDRRFAQLGVEHRDIVALIDTKEQRQYSYGQLLAGVNQLAGALASRPECQPNALIGLYLPPSFELTLGCFALMQLGCAFVPLDRNYPDSRIETMIEQGKLAMVLCLEQDLAADSTTNSTAKLAAKLMAKYQCPWLSVNQLLNAEVGEGKDECEVNTPVGDEHDIAYVIFTSGSTGKPKGVTISHKNWLAYADSALDFYHIDAKGAKDGMAAPAHSRLLQFCSIAFDIFIEELTLTLLNAGTLVLRPQQQLPSAEQFWQWIEQYQIDTVSLPTAYWHQLCDDGQLSQYLVDSQLQRLILGGEALKTAQLKRFKDAGGSKIALFNTYGPTETTVIASGYRVDYQKLFTTHPSSDSKLALGKASEIVVPIGTELKHSQLYIVQGSTQQQAYFAPTGAIGELYIGGDGVGPGYIGRDDLTAQQFVNLTVAGVELGRVYRSGDLVRVNSQGQLEFIGRCDSQVKISGFRVELAEIEQQLRSHQGVDDAVVVRAGNSKDKLWAYLMLANDKASIVEQNVEQKVEQIRQDMLAILPAYMVPSAISAVAAWPLTANGKVDYKKLPDLSSLASSMLGGLLDAQPYLPPSTPLQWQLAHIWASLLDIDSQALGIDHNFFALGGSSLVMMRMLAIVNEEFVYQDNQTIDLKIFYRTPTIANLSGLLSAIGAISASQNLHQQQNSQRSIPVVTDLHDVPASAQQQRLWMLNRFSSEQSAAYHLSQVFCLAGQLDITKLSSAFYQIVERHHSLRTVFYQHSGKLMQKVLPACEYLAFAQISHQQCENSDGSGAIVSLIDLSGNDQNTQQIDGLLQGFIAQPFDLSTDCTLRVLVIKQQSNVYQLCVCAHHIATDGASVAILIDEVNQLYRHGQQTQLTPLPVQYRDYSVWQGANQAQTQRQLDYWKQQLSDIEPCHGVPLDYPRPDVQTYRGEVFKQLLDRPTSDLIRQFAQDKQVSLFTLMQTAFALLLSRYSHSDDILMGTGVANRPQTELSGLIGCFINTLVLRQQLQGKLNVTEQLVASQGTIMDALAAQSLPFEYLVEQLKPARNTSYSPIFQIMFVLHNNERCELDLPKLSVEYPEQPQSYAKFDLTLNVFDRQDSTSELLVEWEFNSDLFKVQTIASMARDYRQLLINLQANPHAPLSQITLHANNRKSAGFNLTYQGYQRPTAVSADSRRLRVHQFIEQLAETKPNDIAVEVIAPVNTLHVANYQHNQTQQLSYKQLNDKANQMAAAISAAIGEHMPKTHMPDSQWIADLKGQKVALMLPHDMSLPICLLALQKLSVCYVPIDTEAPLARIEQIVQLAQIQFCLTGRSLAQKRGAELAAVGLNCIDISGFDLNQYAQQGIELEYAQDDLAYVLFTSGSTGVPKGVEICHNNLTNLLLSMAQKPGISACDKLLCVTPLTFDISELEIYLPLISGATLVLGANRYATDSKAIGMLIEQHQITMMQATPTMWRILLAQDSSTPWQGNENLVALCGGEALTEDLAALLVGKTKALWNMYGPTETTIWSFTGLMEKSPQKSQKVDIHLGEAVSHTGYCLLDSNFHQVPVGVAGQLFISGLGLAKCYLGREDLTDKAFIELDDFCANDELNDNRWYATGDLVRVDDDGRMRFIGRGDQQIKLRGFRIEPGEIEAWLNRHPDINDSLVMIHKDANDRENYDRENYDRANLVAYYTLTHRNLAKQPTTAQLREHLSEHIPAYMLPSVFTVLEQFTLTSSGKKDRNKLPAPMLASNKLKTEFVKPGDPLEQFIVDKLKSRLKLAQIGCNDNFFEIGATSLDLVQLASQLEQHTQLTISPVTLFDKSTTSLLAAHLNQQLNQCNEQVTSQQSTSAANEPEQNSKQINKARERLQARARRKVSP